ncbi:MAG: hypothetical protein RMM08_10350 [Armatimonadota bacterium]|nr:type II secretion system protein GspG [bacterium]MDW8321753.1 hypothetical protein [Armatimonadota bacterium]
MRASRGCKIGCLTAVLVMVVAVALAVRWWTAPIDIPRPQRPPEPADNPYDVYRSLAVYTSQIFQSDPMLSYAERELFPLHQTAHLEHPELVHYLLRQLQPVRLEYRRHLHKPCVVIMEYTYSWRFPELAEFRRWASIEALDIAASAQEGDFARAVDDYRTVLLLAEQVRNGGNLIHYFTGAAMQAAVNREMSQILRVLPAEQCDKLVEATREWQRYYVAPVQVVKVERDFFLNVLHDLREGKYEAVRLLAEYRSFARWNPRWLNLRRAAHEGARYFQQVEQQLCKPINQQKHIEEPNHPVARTMAPLPGATLRRTGYTESRIRMLACAAAVRAYRLRRGSYPHTLSEAGVADLNRDPFTGGGFVYKPSERGFLLYSVGEDGVDDGGKRAPERWSGKGDVTLIPFYARHLDAHTAPGEPVWLR